MKVIVFAAILAALRVWIGFTVEPEHFSWVSLYKDVAHLFMGGLAVYAHNLQPFQARFLLPQNWGRMIRMWRLFWLMNLLEIAVATLSRI